MRFNSITTPLKICANIKVEFTYYPTENMIANIKVQFTYYPTEIMIANIFNKSIPSKKHEDFTMDCGVAPKSGETKDENLIKKLDNLVL